MSREIPHPLPRLEIWRRGDQLELRLAELRWQWMQKIRVIQGGRWDASGNCWFVPDTESNLRYLSSWFTCEFMTEQHSALLAPSPSPPETPPQGESAPDPAGAPNALDEALAEFDRSLRLRGRSPRTRKAYTFHVRTFAQFVGQGFPEFGEDVIRRYLLDMLDKGRTRVYVNQAVSAIKSFGKEILHAQHQVPDIPRPKTPRTLPTVLSRDELLRILSAEPNIKHRAIIALTYAGGLRVSEVSSLRVEDLDIGRDMIHVKKAKGDKDRYTLLGDSAREAVDAYRKWFPRKEGWLFPGRRPGAHITARTVQKIVRDATKAAGIEGKHITPHSLRHSFATHLIEDGVNLVYVQRLLGHRRPETTQRYIQVAQADLMRVRSPLDNIYSTLRKSAPEADRTDSTSPPGNADREIEGTAIGPLAERVKEDKVYLLKGRRFRIVRTKGFIR